ncbi:SRPBCC family protein [Runella slithyformis]|nr:SRPBCC family protein [Runella slithyformis]
MKINENAPVKQKNQIVINAVPEKVWAVLTDINQWGSWNEKITEAQASETQKVGARFDWKVNGASIKSILHTVSTHKAFGWSGTTFGGSAIHNWFLTAHQAGTLVNVEESMEGWLVSLFKNKMNRDLAKDMQFWLEMLKRECEK